MGSRTRGGRVDERQLDETGQVWGRGQEVGSAASRGGCPGAAIPPLLAFRFRPGSGRHGSEAQGGVRREDAGIRGLACGSERDAKNIVSILFAGDPFLSFALSQELHGTKIQGHDVEVRSVQKEADLRGCEAMYFAGSRKAANEKWLQKLKGTSALTFGEEKSFLDDGAMVRILCQSDEVQFEVNLECIRNAGLKINARLLALAKGVTKTGRPSSD